MSRAPFRRSALEAFACPAHYRAKYEDGFDDTSGPALRGIAFHEAAGCYISKLAAAGADHDPTLAVTALEEALASRALAWELTQDVRENLWPRFVEWFRLDVDAFLIAEERQTDGAVSWTPDLVYAYPDRLHITDWKTYYVGMTEGQANEAFQTLFYLWQAKTVWPGFPAYRMEYVFPRLGYSTQSRDFTAAELDTFGDHVQALIGQIEAARERNYWPAVPGDHCKFCTLKCALADDPRRMPLRVTTPSEAQDTLLRFVALQRQVGQLRDALKGYCEEHGPVAANGVEAHHKVIEARRWTVDAVLDVLAEHGITDLREAPAIEVSASALKPYLETKKRAAIGAALRAVGTVKTSERFEVSKPINPAVAATEATEAA